MAARVSKPYSDSFLLANLIDEADTLWPPYHAPMPRDLRRHRSDLF
jgi:hypothetical protein